MYKVRDALDLLDQRALVDLAAARDVRGARSNDERRQVLARSYRGNAAAFLADLPRSELLFLAREWGLGGRGAAIASKSRDELSALLLPCFAENGAGPRSGRAHTQAAPALAAEEDVDAGLGLTLTERGVNLAESYGGGLDPSSVAWALSGSGQGKRRGTLEGIADPSRIGTALGWKASVLEKGEA